MIVRESYGKGIRELILSFITLIYLEKFSGESSEVFSQEGKGKKKNHIFPEYSRHPLYQNLSEKGEMEIPSSLHFRLFTTSFCGFISCEELLSHN